MTAVLGDKLSHGGSIVQGSTKIKFFGKPVARVGDLAICSVHGPVTIVTGVPNSNVEGKPVARAGYSICSCGAQILPNKYKGI